MSKLTDYPFEVRPLSAGEGGGYLISFPDFAECISDGDTADDAVENGREGVSLNALVFTFISRGLGGTGDKASGESTA